MKTFTLVEKTWSKNNKYFSKFKRQEYNTKYYTYTFLYNVFTIALIDVT